MSEEIRSAKDFVSPKKGRKSPATRMIEEAGPEYYSISQTAQIVGMHIETVRRLLRSDNVAAPSHVIVRGVWHIWLLNEDDLREVGAWFNQTRAVEKHLKEKHENPPKEKK